MLGIRVCSGDPRSFLFTFETHGLSAVPGVGSDG